MIRIVHPEYCCEECAAPGAIHARNDSIPLYHFGWNDGHNVSIAHGCEHFVRRCNPGQEAPAGWWDEHLVSADATCHMRGTGLNLHGAYFVT
jgi:hypothetical protein